MELVRRSRLRTGAISCTLYRDGADPSTFLLIQFFAIWEEHLRQHTGRLTGTDQERERAHAVAVEERTLPAHPPGRTTGATSR